MIEWTTGHQPEILKTLEHSIEDYLLDQAWTLFGWSPDRTRLVVTGDLTAIGDDESLETALDSIDDIATTAGITPWVIHGNHDVWSGSPRAPLPMYFGTAALKARHQKVIKKIAERFETESKACDFPRKLKDFYLVGSGTKKRRLVFWAINTVTHEPLANSMALGEATMSLGEIQGDQLRTLRDTMKATDINVVFCHHPIFDPFNGKAHRENPLGRMCLVDGYDVSRALGPKKPGESPLADVFVSGHVHNTFPELGSLDSWDRKGCFLRPGQHQVIVGSACQDSFPTDAVLQGRFNAKGEGFDPRCYWQALSFFRDREPADGGLPRVTLVREVFTRGVGGTFEKSKQCDRLTWNLSEDE